jgi:signal transduction histidine kinase/ligand-binding sensor domain-containing protein
MLSGFYRKIAACRVLVCLVATTGVIPSLAIEPGTPLSRLGRQAWTMENGLPQNTVPVLLQSHDGFLWAGTELGLARFDGVSFRIFDHAADPAFPDAEIHCLLDAGVESGLWIGTGDGLVRWKNGNVARFTSRDGLPGNSILGIAQSSDGTVWIWTQGGLARWSGEKIEAVGNQNGLPGDEITSIAPDRSGGLWVGTVRGVAIFRDGHWHPGPSAVMEDAGSKLRGGPALVKAVANGDVLVSNGSGIFREHDGVVTKILAKETLPADEISFLDRLSDGTIAAASKSSVVLVQETSSSGRVIGRFTVAKELPGSRIESMYADRSGCLWIGTSRGLVRISTSSAKGREIREVTIRALPPSDPLASNAVISLMEDREGDLWAGTETAGLHILRDARFRVIGTGDGLSADATTAVVQDAKQTLWIGTRNNGLNRVSETSDGQLSVTGMTTANGLLSNVILSLAPAPDGDLWIGTPDGLSRFGSAGLRNFTSVDGLPDDFIRSLLVAPDNSVWIGTRRGLTHMVAGKFQSLTHADGLGSDLVGALAQTADGDLWIATLNGLSRLHDGQIRNYTTADGLSSNVITALDVTRDGTVWIGTQDGGLNLWDGKRFARISAERTAEPGVLPNAIHGLVHDDRGHLWLASDSGLTRVALAALLKCGAITHSGPCALTQADISNFTTADGLRSRETSSNSHPTICRASDGKLWFTTPRGVIVADPLHFPASLTMPPVVIERVAVDDRDIRPNQLARITAGAMRFQFDYAGLSFASPQKMRYQYTLEGFDHSWTDAGTRRTAYYTNIPPGNYRFRVRAVDDTVARSSLVMPGSSASYTPDYELAEASQSFRLLPHYYQTIWFRTLIVLMAGVLVALLFRRRVLRVEREFRAVMAERNRIAREIHDTLAQGYVGISLQLEILGELLRHNRADAAQNHLTLTQEMVRDGLNDARQSIWALRSQDSGDETLPIRLRRIVEQAGDSEIAAGLVVHGTYRALAGDVEQEILRIAQEAIHNVKRHAAASQLSVRLEYDDRALALTVSDDGRGFAKAGAASPPGHFGLTGMRERSEIIHGTIEIVSEPGNGTTVRLTVPAMETHDKRAAEDDADSKNLSASKEQQ